MRKRVGLILTVVAAGVLSIGPSAGAQCFSSTFLEIGVPGVTTFYYDDRSGTPPIPGVIVGPDGTWIWEETNGQRGLQRGGNQWILDMVGLGGWDKICIESATPDRLWF